MPAHLRRSLLLCILANTAIGCSSSPLAPADFGDCSPQSSGQAGWSYLGLEGVSITSFANTPWGLFVGSGSGVYRCHPESLRWQHMGLENHGVSSLVFLAGPTPRLLVGMSHHGAGAPWHALYSTENAGRTWTVSVDGLTPRDPQDLLRVYSLAVDPGDPDRVFLGTTAAVARSTNGGASWEWVFNDDRAWGPGLRSLTISPHRDGHVWASGSHAAAYGLINRTGDWGQTWQSTDPTPYHDNVIYSLVVDDLSENRLWAGAAGGILYSEDFGTTWSYVDLDDGVSQRIRLITEILFVGARIFAVGGTNRPFPDMSTGLVGYLSEDRGATWTRFDPPPGTRGAAAATSTEGDRLLVAIADGGGIWQFTPGD